MLAWGFILLGSLAWLGSAHPIESDVEPMWLVRERRSPMAARTMILIRAQPSNGGYNYEKPGRAFNPHAAMGAYATGGTVAAGSFYGSPSKQQECGDCNKSGEQQPEDSQAPEEKSEPEAPEEEEVPAEEEPSKTPAVPERKPKASKAPKRRPVKDEEEDDDDDEDSVAPKGGRNGGSVYRNFFPMTFAAADGRRSRDTEGGAGGGEGGRGPVTAIANSFSKGRGAIASSSAVAHGNPEATQNKQSQPSRYRARQ